MAAQRTMKEVCLIDAGISNIMDLALSPDTETLNLHCNSLTTIDNLHNLAGLRHLDLSSNAITTMAGLVGLVALRTLNLSCNLINVVENLQDLQSLMHLNLSYNQISEAKGLRKLWGPSYQLRSLELQGNNLTSVEDLIQSLRGLQCLEELTLEKDGSSNPVCQMYGYRTALFNALPQLKILDGRDRRGQIMTKEISLNDIPGLEHYLEFLVSSDANDSTSQERSLQLITPKIDSLLEKFRKGALRSDDQTTSNPTTNSEQEVFNRAEVRDGITTRPEKMKSAKDHENRILELEKKLSDMVERRTTTQLSTPINEDGQVSEVEQKSKVIGRRGQQTKAAKREPTDESEQSDTTNQQMPGKRKLKRKSSLKKGRVHKQVPSSASCNSLQRIPGQRTEGRSFSAERKTKSTVEQDSEKLIFLQELDQERVRRWKAEQAAIKLADRIKVLQTQASEEQEIQSVAVHATSRIKEVLMREKDHRMKLEDERNSLKRQVETLVGKLEEVVGAIEGKDKALEAMEITAKRMESERLQQQAHEAKQLQEYQLKLGASSRELDLLRSHVKNSEVKITQLQELLATREQEHRNEMKHFYKLDSRELQEVVNQQVAREKESHQKEILLKQEKIGDLSRQYADLEDEFRLALRLEEDRYQKVYDAYETLRHESSTIKDGIEVATSKERRASALVNELTTMVKEQKGRLNELSRSKQEMATKTREQVQSLDTQLEEARKKLLHLEAIGKEKIRLQTQLVAQESVIEGLKAERKLWGQELAQQGSSLAQDRGRLEAKIEALTAEVASLKKQQEADNEGLKIKTKVIDDQTDTIRKLKEAVSERDDQIKKVRKESLEIQRSLEDTINEEQTAGQDLREQVEHLEQRKDALKEQVQELQMELDESQRSYRALDRKWKDKGDLISQLEEQVMHVKKTFEEREAKVKAERDKAMEQERACKERMRTMDNAFRKQMETAQRGYDETMEILRQEREAEVEEANQKVIQVEEEMRQVLFESANQKKAMEDKLKRVTQVFSDLQQDLG
ncbi:leucine-rich repeat and coiled-coil domain-containing protein 1-like isoform X3 [Apostichopus japonicus]|uniref:leucine-rich repeat and coiled-coil domain-containing protein 1-like isoform X3 n=1 Tax=Stichopus japonicus TaxID=307972 RepID=UPI003AB204A1